MEKHMAEYERLQYKVIRTSAKTGFGLLLLPLLLFLLLIVCTCV